MARPRHRDIDEPRNYSISISEVTYPIFKKVKELSEMDGEESFSSLLFYYAEKGMESLGIN